MFYKSANQVIGMSAKEIFTKDVAAKITTLDSTVIEERETIEISLTLGENELKRIFRMIKSTRLTITGSVQGAFFRQFIKENANKHKLKGYVRNLEDGKVEVFLEGQNEDIDAMISICKRGPQHSQIRHVDEKSESFQDFKEFKVLNF